MDEEGWKDLQALMRHTANRSEYVEFKGATPDQVELVTRLRSVAQEITNHCQKVLTDGDVGGWQELAGLLEVAAYACREQVANTMITIDEEGNL